MWIIFSIFAALINYKIADKKKHNKILWLLLGLWSGLLSTIFLLISGFIDSKNEMAEIDCIELI
ncbi:MAG: hypothetical protein ACOCUI_02240 [bacterium]